MARKERQTKLNLRRTEVLIAGAAFRLIGFSG
ncbi:hypothetical protein PanWU01x14_009180 [Parasponia andersonii]|uniref:Uncharacterized protein n=1 Tax=Parasponia andersonii TaxID=3476 RepID=A0A2P5E2B6_PARAD|nr:hypothetical protein PanWU01x14_009180 [Parasponia andersonii]